MKKFQKIALTFVTVIFMMAMLTISNATQVNQKEFEEFILTKTSVDFENLTDADMITLYEEVSEEYTNEELADIIDSYSADLQKEGISEDTINAGTKILRTTDTEELKKILEEDVNLDEVKARLEKGETIDDVISDTQVNPGVIFFKLLLANSIFKTFLIISLIIGIYMLAVRWLIYRKAGKHGWASIIPIYRDVVWLKIAGISPWVLLLWLIPVIGWLILGIIMIVSNFKLAKNFSRSGWFGLGLWIIPIIFQSILAFSSKSKYIKDKE